MNAAATTAPTRLLRRSKLVLSMLAHLALLEIQVRRRSLPQLCARAQIGFGAFDVPTWSKDLEPLPLHVVESWRAVETALRWWPLARRRPCLRRSLLLGRQIAYLDPVLVLSPVSTDPLEVHAFLVTRGGHHLDVGSMTSSASHGLR